MVNFDFRLSNERLKKKGEIEKYADVRVWLERISIICTTTFFFERKKKEKKSAALFVYLYLFVCLFIFAH